MSTAMTVWMSAWRTGLSYHRVVGGHGTDLRTACGRPVQVNGTALGFLMPDWEAENDKHANPCATCWPEGRSS